MRNVDSGRFGAAALALTTALLLSGCGLFGAGEPERDAEGQVVEDAETDASALEVGDCMTDNGTAEDPAIMMMPCADEHQYEVFATTELPGDEYPGDREADAAAQEFCSGEFEKFVGITYDESELLIQYFYPQETSWTDESGRKISCLIAQAAEAPTTESLQNSNR
ncbi:septum formation family protein [Arthrobacter sp. H5]|uniref:septum formation family protein n=1 Tax=Arthrobacter sp. H5 TaxID=1267973 RepID=UPI0004B206B4|nr:septum formation family protein [Arthrobacter sp. H5]